MPPFATKIWKNICSWKQILRNFSEYICKQLKYHQHRIRSKTGISLDIILIVFSCLIVSFVPLKFLLLQQHHICLFLLTLSVNLLWSQVCTFYCPPGRRGSFFFRRKQMYTLLLCQGCYSIGKKHKQEIQLCYGAYSETKKHFEIPICFWFQWMPLRNLFLIEKIENFQFYI